MTDPTRRYMLDKPDMSARDAYDLTRKAASDPKIRQSGVNLIGDTLDDISLLYHATRHFGIEVLGMQVNGKVRPVTGRVKARKAKEWRTFINGQNINAVRDLMVHGFDINKTGKKRKTGNGFTAMQKLDQLIGLNQVKAQIRDIGHLMKNRNDRRRARLPAIETSQHLVFTGNPGTGKTSVARLVGEIYRELGLLKKGQFIEIHGRGLIAEYIGHTAVKTQEIVTQALDGVLFIDEAYALAQSDLGNDYGSEAVATLIKMMEDHRDRLIVIIAGYEEEMEKLLESNPGLKSRFKTKIDFQDYSAQQLYEIFLKLCTDHRFMLTKEAKEKAHGLFFDMHESKGEQFGNGRSVRNVFDRCVLNQAGRLAGFRKPPRKELQTIKQADIPQSGEVDW